MNTTKTRNTATTITTTIAVAAAVTVLSAIAPESASAKRADPTSGPGIDCVCTDDFAVELAQRKARWAQYYADALGL
jgi:hypothetical protein